MEGANHTWSGGRDGRGVWEVRRRCWRLARQGTIHWQVTSNTGREGGQKGADFLACARVCASGCKQRQRQVLIGKGSCCRGGVPWYVPGVRRSSHQRQQGQRVGESRGSSSLDAFMHHSNPTQAQAQASFLSRYLVRLLVLLILLLPLSGPTSF